MRIATLFSVLVLTACASAVEPRSEVDAGTDAMDASVAPDAGFPDAQITSTPTVAFFGGDPPGRLSTIVYGAPTHLRAEGLSPGERYTLRGTLWGYESEAVFVAGADGVVDTSRDAPESGTYEGVEPEGLIWSMRRISDATAPDFDVLVTVSSEDVELMRATLHREPMGANASWTAVREPGVVGTLVVPDDAPRPPVVLVLGGSEGGIPEFTAAYVSTFGVAAFAVGYFGALGLPRELERIPVETVHRAISWLQERPEIDASRIAIWGGSRGSELALMSAATSTAVRLVIAEVPSDVRWGSVSAVEAPAWTWESADLPYLTIPPDSVPETEMWNGMVAYRFTPTFEATLDAADAATIGAAEIAVEEIQARIVLVGGSDDGVWPSCRFGERAMSRLIASGHAAIYDDLFICFEGAGHAIGPPGWPTAEAYALYHPTLRSYLVLGGTPRGTATAQRSSHRTLQQLLTGL